MGVGCCASSWKFLASRIPVVAQWEPCLCFVLSVTQFPHEEAQQCGKSR